MLQSLPAAAATKIFCREHPCLIEAASWDLAKENDIRAALMERFTQHCPLEYGIKLSNAICNLD